MSFVVCYSLYTNFLFLFLLSSKGNVFNVKPKWKFLGQGCTFYDFFLQLIRVHFKCYFYFVFSSHYLSEKANRQILFVIFFWLTFVTIHVLYVYMCSLFDGMLDECFSEMKFSFLALLLLAMLSFSYALIYKYTFFFFLWKYMNTNLKEINEKWRILIYKSYDFSWIIKFEKIILFSERNIKYSKVKEIKSIAISRQFFQL